MIISCTADSTCRDSFNEGVPPELMPALGTRMPMGPCAASDSATAFATCGAEVDQGIMQ